jgi:uncharacterized protein (TIGR02145 family)
MERLPLLSGATLTETSAPGVGKVVAVPGNNQGVWVVGNARNAGSFSATVKLLTAVKNVGGACVYGSKYPPVGEYSGDAAEISFIGTPMYDIQLAKPGGGSVTVKSGDTFLLPCDYTLTSFTDATGAPGIMKCIAPANPVVVGASYQCSGMVTLGASSPGAIIEWYADAGATTMLHIGANYTTPEIETSTTYYVQARVGDCLSARVPVLATVITAGCCTAPGATGVTFAKFNPCAGTPSGSTYTLTDDRDQKTYKVKYMPDGRYWMVQDLKFGDKCKNLSYNTITSSDRLDGVNSSGIYYGNCSAATTTATANRTGYYYDWAAVLNKPAVFTTTVNIGCSGTHSGTSGNNPGACQGICPAGWHVPTASNGGEFDALINAIGSCIQTAAACSGPNEFFPNNGDSMNENGSLRMAGSTSSWHSSTWISTGIHMCTIEATIYNAGSTLGRPVRCVRNY